MKVSVFHSTQCPVCQNMVPVYLMSQELKAANLEFIDIDTQSELCVGKNILAVPTVIVVNNHGREIGRKIGYMNEEGILAWLIQIGAV